MLTTNDNYINSLNVALSNKMRFMVAGEVMKIVNVSPRKGITKRNEVVVHVHLKSLVDESTILITGSSKFVCSVIGRAITA